MTTTGLISILMGLVKKPNGLARVGSLYNNHNGIIACRSRDSLMLMMTPDMRFLSLLNRAAMESELTVDSLANRATTAPYRKTL